LCTFSSPERQHACDKSTWHWKGLLNNTAAHNFASKFRMDAASSNKIPFQQDDFHCQKKVVYMCPPTMYRVWRKEKDARSRLGTHFSEVTE